jgi:hypothetical protein
VLSARCTAHLGSGYAERVDVPLSIAAKLATAPLSKCRAHGCWLHLELVVTNDGDQDVWAMDCRIEGVDASGMTLFRRDVATAPAGMAVRARRSMTDFASVRSITKAEANRLQAVRGTCEPYVWHGDVPI